MADTNRRRRTNADSRYVRDASARGSEGAARTPTGSNNPRMRHAKRTEASRQAPSAAAPSLSGRIKTKGAASQGGVSPHASQARATSRARRVPATSTGQSMPGRSSAPAQNAAHGKVEVHQGNPRHAAGRARHAGSPLLQQRPAEPSPANAEGAAAGTSAVRTSASGNQPSHAAAHDANLIQQRRRKRKHRKILMIVGIVLAVLLVGAGTAFGIYTTMLNDRLAIDDKAQEQAVNDALVPAEVSQPFYALLIGSDSREGSGTSSRADESGDNERSDVIILVRVDAPNRQITMVSIPRDTPLRLDDGSVVKINEAYNIGGAAYTIEVVSELTGVPISHYGEVHFSELQTLVDNLGGVTVDVPIELSYKDALTGETVTIQPGEQTLDGQQAQIFARARHEYGTDQDANRQNSVRKLAEAIVKQILSRPVYELPGAVMSAAECVGTDMRSSDLIALATAFATGSGDITMYNGSGPSDGDINNAANGLWLCYENPDGWQKLMDVVNAGGDPSTVDYSDTTAVPAAPGA